MKRIAVVGENNFSNLTLQQNYLIFQKKISSLAEDFHIANFKNSVQFRSILPFNSTIGQSKKNFTILPALGASAIFTNQAAFLVHNFIGTAVGAFLPIYGGAVRDVAFQSARHAGLPGIDGFGVEFQSVD